MSNNLNKQILSSSVPTYGGHGGTIYNHIFQQKLTPTEVANLEQQYPDNYMIATGIIAPIADNSICNKLYFEGTFNESKKKIKGVFYPAQNILVQKYDTRDFDKIPASEKIVTDTERFWGRIHLYCPNGDITDTRAGVVLIEYVKPLKFVK